jgi:hypothetical protein
MGTSDTTKLPVAADAPATTRRIFVRNLILDAEIGVHTHEKNRRQRICVNVDVAVADGGAAHHDQLKNVVCYENIVDGVKAIWFSPTPASPTSGCGWRSSTRCRKPRASASN